VPIASFAADTAYTPASTMKLVTSAGALLSLGPDFRFETHLYEEPGAVREGNVLRGNLVVKGFGDPVLATRSYARTYLEGAGGSFNQLVRPVRTEGVRQVTGRILADESFLDSRRVGDRWRSYYSLYCPPLSGLSVNQGYAGTSRGRYVTDPPRAAATRLAASLKSIGVAHRGAVAAGTTPQGARLVGAVKSPPLSRILVLMNHESDNFIAETLRKDVGAYAGTRGSTTEGSRVTAALLEDRGILGANDEIVDGSGLSRANRVSASTFVRLLAAADADPSWGAALVESLPRGGEGTLIRRFLTEPARSRVRAKTGYINGVSSLAGTVTSVNGTRYAFAFLMNDGDITGAKNTQERIVTMLAKGAADDAAALPGSPTTTTPTTTTAPLPQTLPGG
jgi:serine-type D-Ala-D-Ala carboxypeptidase/endopeptidase (penicillin-binding protein 4)